MPADHTISHICATGLKDTNVAVRHNPLVKFEVGKQEVWTSVAKKAGPDPSWEDVVTIPADPEASQLKVLVYNHHTFRPDSLVGSASLPLTQLQSGHGLERVALMDRDGKPAGELSFRVNQAGSGHLHTTSAHPAAVADPGATYRADDASLGDHPHKAMQAPQQTASAGYSGGGAIDIAEPQTGGGLVHDPHGYGASRVEPPIIGGLGGSGTSVTTPPVEEKANTTGASKSAGIGFSGGGATDYTAPESGGGMAHDPYGYSPDPHGYGVSKVEAPIIGGIGGAAAGTAAEGYSAQGHGGGIAHDPAGYGVQESGGEFTEPTHEGGIQHPEAVDGTSGYSGGGATVINQPPVHGLKRLSQHGDGIERLQDPIVGSEAFRSNTTGSEQAGDQGSRMEGAKTKAADKTVGAVDNLEGRLEDNKNVLLKHKEDVAPGEQPTFTERVREATYNTIGRIQETAEQAKAAFIGKHETSAGAQTGAQ